MIGASRKQRLVADINITPFTDVILVLLVIFMITTPLISQANIKVGLPQAKSGVARSGGAGNNEAEITISREGVVYLNGKIVTTKELRRAVAEMRADNPGLSVTVRSDRSTRFQEIVNVLDPLNDLGVAKLNIAVTSETQ